MGMSRKLRAGYWLLTFAVASVSCTSIEPQPTPLTAPLPPNTRATTHLGAKELADGRFAGLAFSGGGSRAALFGAAVMRELDRADVLQQVDVLSAVSGGALRLPPMPWRTTVTSVSAMGRGAAPPKTPRVQSRR